MFPDSFFDQFKNKTAVVIEHVDEVKVYNQEFFIILCCDSLNPDSINNNIDIICFDCNNNLSYPEIVLVIKDLYNRGVKAAILINNNEVLYAYKNVITPIVRNGQDLISLAKNLGYFLNNRKEVVA